MKNTFLQQFNPIDDSALEDIIPGRAAKLPLRGPNGALDLYACYMPTGTQNEDDKYQLINKLRESLEPNNAVLSILMGDWIS